jgi:hypothetical protein
MNMQGLLVRIWREIKDEYGGGGGVRQRDEGGWVEEG